MHNPIDGIIWEADADTLLFSRIEGNVDEILGYTVEDWLSTPDFWQSVLHPDDADWVIETCTAASRKRLPHRLTYRMVAADGRTVWLQDNVKVVDTGERAILFGVMTDVTELVAQRQELTTLNAENAHFRVLFDLVPVAIWEEDWTNVLRALRDLKAQGVRDIHDYVRNKPEFVEIMLGRLSVISVNNAAVEMFRAADAPDLIDRAKEVFKADQPHSVFITALDAILRGEDRIEGVATLRRLDGEDLQALYRIALPHLDDPVPRVVICEMDISAAHLANERFELVTRATTDVIWDFDIANDTLWASDGLKRTFGLDPAVMYDSLSNWTDRIHPDDIGPVMQNFDEILNKGRDDWEQEYRFRRGDGVYAIVRDEGFILRDSNGRAVRMVGSLVDVSGQRRLEEQLIQSQKLEALGKLTSGIAHDFNNLLTIIMGSLEALEERLSINDTAREHLEVAGSAVDRSMRLINQLLSYSRQQPMSPQPLDMCHQITAAMRMVERALGGSIHVVLRDAPGLWRCRADPNQFDNALLNLCINARDAMSDGGTLTIAARNETVRPDDMSRTNALIPGRYVVLSVTDTGHGMDAATLRSAFDPFFTTKEPGQGSGLGLSMVQGFAHQSGGLATIRSEPGAGTVVELYLPSLDAEPDRTPSNEAELDKPKTGAGRILLVEDQDLLRDHMVMVLESLGYAVIAAETAPDAAEVLHSDLELDLLLTDVMLPGGVSGLDLARTARDVRPDLPVRFTSGFAETDLNGGAQLINGQNLLRKPFRKRQLAAFVHEAIERL